MRYFLFVLLIIFSTQGFATYKDKVVICKRADIEEGSSDKYFYFSFYNDDEAKKYNLRRIQDKVKWVSDWSWKVSADSDFIIFRYINITKTLDRKTLILTSEVRDKDNKMYFTAEDICEVYSEVRNKASKKIKQLQKQQQKLYDKAKEGNKI